MSFRFENDRIFELLRAAAQRSEFQQHRHSTAIVHKGKVLAVGINQKKSHTLQKQFSGRDTKIWLHSELAAMIKVINRYGPEILGDCELYNLRLTKGGNIGLAKPCETCSRAIDSFGIGKVFWT